MWAQSKLHAQTVLTILGPLSRVAAGNHGLPEFTVNPLLPRGTRFLLAVADALALPAKQDKHSSERG